MEQLCRLKIDKIAYRLEARYCLGENMQALDGLSHQQASEMSSELQFVAEFPAYIYLISNQILRNLSKILWIFGI